MNGLTSTQQDAADYTEDAAVRAARLSGNGVEALAGAATVAATLALAAETRALREAQDTANLIAWAALPPMPDHPKNRAFVAHMEERLGLTGIFEGKAS